MAQNFFENTTLYKGLDLMIIEYIWNYINCKKAEKKANNKNKLLKVLKFIKKLFILLWL